MLEALGTDYLVWVAISPGLRTYFIMRINVSSLDEEALASKIRQLFCDEQYFQKIEGLCQKRKNAFIFRVKEENVSDCGGVIRS